MKNQLFPVYVSLATFILVQILARRIHPTLVLSFGAYFCVLASIRLLKTQPSKKQIIQAAGLFPLFNLVSLLRFPAEIEEMFNRLSPAGNGLAFAVWVFVLGFIVPSFLFYLGSSVAVKHATRL